MYIYILQHIEKILFRGIYIKIFQAHRVSNCSILVYKCQIIFKNVFNNLHSTNNKEFTLIQLLHLILSNWHDFYKYSGYKVIFILRDKITWVNIKTMLTERHEAQKTEYCMTICMKLQKIQNYRDRKQISGCLGTREDTNSKKGMKKTFGGDRNALHLLCDVT